jgi:phosphoglycerate dehydrogenase-like enzyme
VTDRPTVVVTASEADPPPGIAAAEDLADLRFARGDDVAAAIPGAHALFFYRARKPWVQAAWPKADELRWIQSASDGLDGLLFAELVESEVVVTNARGVFEEAIAEWAIAAILAFETGLYRSIVDTVGGRWEERERGRIEGRRLLVVGPGPIGRATARRARDLGMHVSFVGRAPRRDEELGPIGGPEDLGELLRDADHVLDALPLAPGTEGFFGAKAFAAMKPTATFLNVGRGGTVVERELIDALRTGAIGGAALDVYEVEPLPAESPLWSLPNVIVSPHVCGDVEGWEGEVAGLFVDNLRRFVSGEPLRNVVDKVAGFGVG